MLVNLSRPRHVTLFSCSRVARRVSEGRLFTTTLWSSSRPRHMILEGRDTDHVEGRAGADGMANMMQDPEILRPIPFYLETGYSIFAKRPSRPFPPPFVSVPSGSFSDPLTTHDRAGHRRPTVEGQYLRGITNGDDAILVSHGNFLCVNDGVGAWAQKERGHAALWSRLIAHYWALEIDAVFRKAAEKGGPALDELKPIDYLQTAYENTVKVTTTSDDTTPDDVRKHREPKERKGEIMGTTTATSGLLHYNAVTEEPVLLATQLGDCALFVLRPDQKPYPPIEHSETAKSRDVSDDPPEGRCIYKTKEQWHWFDCPRQLGTNSPDTPLRPHPVAVCDTIAIQPSDIVVVCSDGVTDNLWEHEIVSHVCGSYLKWQAGAQGSEDGVVYMARELMNAARVVAQDPYAESPYMERALDEGIAAEGGKLDDISVVIGICRKTETDSEG